MTGGLLPIFSPQLFTSLVQEWPQGEMLARVPGDWLGPNLVQRLRHRHFTGYVRLEREGRIGILLWYKGRLLEAWCPQMEGFVAGAAAYHALIADLPLVEVGVYSLLAEAIPSLLSLTQGSSRPVSEVPNAVALQLSGALVWEDGHSARAWYATRGRWLFATPAKGLAQGRYWLIQATLKAPPDLLEKESGGDRSSQQRLWEAVNLVLEGYMGRGAGMALKRLQATYTSDNPSELKRRLKDWLSHSLEPGAADMLERLAPT